MKKISIKTPLALILIIIFSGFTVSAYSQDLIPFKNQMTGNLGYMDESGNKVIKAQFYKASTFSDGIAIVSDRLSTYYINRTGTKIFESPYEIEDFSNGYGVARGNRQSYFVNNTGKIVSPVYRYAKSFSDNKAIVWIDGKVCAINKSFKVLFEIEVDPVKTGNYFGQFSNGMMPVNDINNKWGYVDNAGKLVIKPSYVFPGKFYNGRAIVQDTYGKWMVINKIGEKNYEFEMKQHWDMPEYMSLLFKDKLIYTPKRGVIHIVSLLDNSEIEVNIAALSNDYDANIRPEIIGDCIFYDGKAIDLEGKIIWQLDNFRHIESNLYGKYILIEKAYDDIHLYKYDGTEIIFP